MLGGCFVDDLGVVNTFCLFCLYFVPFVKIYHGCYLQSVTFCIFKIKTFGIVCPYYFFIVILHHIFFQERTDIKHHQSYHTTQLNISDGRIEA